MTERVNPLTHCVTCAAELTIDKKRGCKVCRLCHPEPVAAPVPLPKAKAYLDVKMTERRISEMIKEAFETGAVNYVSTDKSRPENIRIEIGMERIRDIIREEMEDLFIQKPPVTKKEIEKLTWRQEAKSLGISLHQEKGGVRKKVDVLADIELRKGADNGKETKQETKKEADQEAA
ncbi:hypothetical protein LCGC14_1589580, partial [marine sediment metagenome]